MGEISYLTGGSQNSSPSVTESIYQLRNSSTIFMSAWLSSPKDFVRAGRVSSEAMGHLDHIVNEIMRARDQHMADGSYDNSTLKVRLQEPAATSVSPVTREEQHALASVGPGNGELPSTGTPLTVEKLLNKIKHRRTDSINFRVEEPERHIFLFGVDKPNKQPDSIVEFSISGFCSQCDLVAAEL